MPKKDVKKGEETEVKALKQAVRTGAAKRVKTAAPAKKTAVAAGKNVSRKVSRKNAEAEDKGGSRTYFAKWTEKDFKRTDREIWFYRASLVVAAPGMFWAVYDRNLLTFFTFFMLAVVAALELRWEPAEVEYEINMEGISIGGKLYCFGGIKSFEVVKKDGSGVVKFQLKNSIFPVKEMYLDSGQDLRFIQALLKHFLPEEPQEDKLFSFTGKESKLTEEEYIDKKVNEYLKGKI